LPPVTSATLPELFLSVVIARVPSVPRVDGRTASIAAID